MNVICPAFGMTESFAGSIYNLDFPSPSESSSYAAVGRCIQGLEVQIVKTSTDSKMPTGEVQIRGPVVFREYYGNPKVTEESFAAGGWFKTGDLGWIDENGLLHLIGRSKETVLINAVHHDPNDIEAVIEQAAIPGLAPGHTLCFGTRPQQSETDHLCIAYSPRYPSHDAESARQANNAIIRETMLQNNARPSVLPLDGSLLKRSSVGKLPRMKIKSLFETGKLDAYKTAHEGLLQSCVTSRMAHPSAELESVLQDEISSTLQMNKSDLSVEATFFEVGVTSLELLAMKARIESRLAVFLSIGTMLQNPTVRALATAMNKKEAQIYDPIVVLQSNHSDRTPLWLFHPGVGNVLVFIELAKRLRRPVYALRAKGFGAGETYFQSIDEAASTCRAAIKSKQPHGPYALAGYCYGAMLAFETAKLLDTRGCGAELDSNQSNEVRFLGSLDLPPHIAWRMRQLDWPACLMHLAYELHVIAWEYEPRGKVANVDVFYAEPLRICAATKEEWVRGPLKEWGDFAREQGGARCHECPGEHYTMLAPEHVVGFVQVLESVLEARGV